MSFSLSEAAVSLLTLTEHTLGSCWQLSSLQKHTWGIPRLLFMGSFDKHPARYGGQGHKEIVMDSQACGLNCSQSHECNSPTTSCDAMDYWTYQSQTTSVPLVPWDSRLKKPQLLKTIPELAEQTLRAACAAASPHPKHMEGQQGTHSMQLAHMGYLSRGGAGLTLALRGVLWVNATACPSAQSPPGKYNINFA